MLTEGEIPSLSVQFCVTRGSIHARAAVGHGFGRNQPRLTREELEVRKSTFSTGPEYFTVELPDTSPESFSEASILTRLAPETCNSARCAAATLSFEAPATSASSRLIFPGYSALLASVIFRSARELAARQSACEEPVTFSLNSSS